MELSKHARSAHRTDLSRTRPEFLTHINNQKQHIADPMENRLIISVLCALDMDSKDNLLFQNRHYIAGRPAKTVPTKGNFSFSHCG